MHCVIMADAIPFWELNDCSPIQKTLMIPLAGRAAARELFPELGFSDPAAERLMASVRVEGGEGFRQDRSVVWGSILRTQAIDEVAVSFFERQPGATVINIGAGLCTRHRRVGAWAGAWIDVDFPEVLKARVRLMPEVQSIAADLNDPTALAGACAQALALTAGRPTLVIVEGVSMFLDEGVFSRVLAILDRELPEGSEIVFDYIHPLTRRISGLQPSLKRTGATYRSGIRSVGDEVLSHPRLELQNARLFTGRYTGALKGTERVLRALMGGSALFDVAHVRVVARGARVTAAARRDHWGVVANTFLGFGVAVAVSAWTSSGLPYLAAQVVAALFMVRAFCLVHELSHASLLPSRRLNDIAGVLASLVCALPYYPWKKIHIEHHTWAGYKEKDPTESDNDFEKLKPAEQRLANLAWRFSLPLLGFSFSLRTFWNYPRLSRLFPSRGDRRALLFGMLIIPLVHGTAAWVFGWAYARCYLPAFGAFLFMLDPIMLSQHVGVPLVHPEVPAGAEPRPIRASEQESLARTLIFPRWFARHVLLGFNYHSLHHARPTLPGHLLDAIPFEATYCENWWTWLRRVKRTSLGELLSPAGSESES